MSAPPRILCPPTVTGRLSCLFCPLATLWPQPSCSPPATLSPPAICVPWPRSVLAQRAPLACPAARTGIAPLATATSGSELLTIVTVHRHLHAVWVSMAIGHSRDTQHPVPGDNAAVPAMGLAQLLSTWHVPISASGGTAWQEPPAPDTQTPTLWGPQHPEAPLLPAVPLGLCPATLKGSKPHPGIGQGAPHLSQGGMRLEMGGSGPSRGLHSIWGDPTERLQLLRPRRQHLFAEASLDTQYVLQKIPTPGVKIA